MGACGSNLLEKLGPEFGKLVACEKGKEFIDQKIRQIKDSFYDQSEKVKKETLSKISSSENQLLNKVKAAVADIDKTSPESLSQAAALRHQSKEDLLGGAEIRNKFASLRQSVEKNLTQQEKNIVAQIDNAAIAQKKNLDQQRPTIPIYDSLPETQQKKVLIEGEKKFGDVIRNQQDQLEKQLKEKLDIKKYTSILSSQQGNLDQITKQAESLIENGKSGLKATSMFC